MKLAELQQHWNEWGKQDPLWAILSSPDKRDNQWDLEEFFTIGRKEIATIMGQIQSLSFPLTTGRALDFGCGVGRLTQPMCEIFAECYGVDIAPSMIELANQYNRHGERCHYVVNDVDDLSIFPDGFFDFIYCNIVLQHMRPAYSTGYMREFVRILSAGGLAVFQVPSHLLEADSEFQPGIGPMAEGSFLAEITAEDQYATAAPGSERTFRVQVRNISPADWPHLATRDGLYELRLGNHWRDAAGALIMLDDQRVKLPTELKSQDTVDLDIPIRMPSQPGHYRLVFDLVQEGVTWFEQKGTEPEIVLVTVTDPAAAAADALSPASMLDRPMSTTDDAPVPDESPVPPLSAEAAPRGGEGESAEPDFVPRIEMYGVRRETVLEVVQQAGGKPVDVVRDFWAGSGWVSFRYFVTK